MIRPYIFRFRRFGFDSDLITRTFFEFFPCFWKTGIYLKISRLSCYCYFYVEWWFMNTFWGGYCKIWGNLLPEPPTPISLYATEYSRERRKSINFGKLRLKFENPIAILICGRARWQPCTIFLCPFIGRTVRKCESRLFTAADNACGIIKFYVLQVHVRLAKYNFRKEICGPLKILSLYVWATSNRYVDRFSANEIIVTLPCKSRLFRCNSVATLPTILEEAIF